MVGLAFILSLKDATLIDNSRPNSRLSLAELKHLQSLSRPALSHFSGFWFSPVPRQKINIRRNIARVLHPAAPEHLPGRALEPRCHDSDLWGTSPTSPTLGGLSTQGSGSLGRPGLPAAASPSTQNPAELERLDSLLIFSPQPNNFDGRRLLPRPTAAGGGGRRLQSGGSPHTPASETGGDAPRRKGGRVGGYESGPERAAKPYGREEPGAAPRFRPGSGGGDLSGPGQRSVARRRKSGRQWRRRHAPGRSVRAAPARVGGGVRVGARAAAAMLRPGGERRGRGRRARTAEPRRRGGVYFF